MVPTLAKGSALPEWAFKAMMKECKYCGCFIMQNDALTARCCINPRCPGHMAHRIKVVVDFLGIKGIGPKTAREYISLYNLKSQFEIIPILKKDKPYVTLADIAMLACIEGYGAVQAEQELSHYACFEDYFADTEKVNKLLIPAKDLLIEAQQYFVLRQPLSDNKIYVMATGSFDGYANRDDYFRYINSKLGDKIHVIQTGKRKTKVSFLLKEKSSADRSKSQYAKENGIQIVTPREFATLLCSYFNIPIEVIYPN